MFSNWSDVHLAASNANQRDSIAPAPDSPSRASSKLYWTDKEDYDTDNDSVATLSVRSLTPVGELSEPPSTRVRERQLSSDWDGQSLYTAHDFENDPTLVFPAPPARLSVTVLAPSPPLSPPPAAIAGSSTKYLSAALETHRAARHRRRHSDPSLTCGGESVHSLVPHQFEFTCSTPKAPQTPPPPEPPRKSTVHGKDTLPPLPAESEYDSRRKNLGSSGVRAYGRGSTDTAYDAAAAADTESLYSIADSEASFLSEFDHQGHPPFHQPMSSAASIPPATLQSVWAEWDFSSSRPRRRQIEPSPRSLGATKGNLVKSASRHLRRKPSSSTSGSSTAATGGSYEDLDDERKWWPRSRGLRRRASVLSQMTVTSGDASATNSAPTTPITPGTEALPRGSLSTMATLERADSSLTLAVGQTQSKAGDWVWEVPSEDVVAGAAQCSLYDQWGNKVDFNSLLPTEYPDKEGSSGFTRLVVFFIGHWWCGLCHDYMLRSIQHLDPEALERAGIRVAIISSGSWKVIASYRERFKVPFPAFVDRGTRLYRTLGMQSAVPNIIGEVKRKERPGYHSRSFAQQATSGLIKGMKLTGFNSPGNMMQQGGEFAFSAGYKCDFAHRMTNRSDHCEATDVIALAEGVKYYEQAEMGLAL